MKATNFTIRNTTAKRTTTGDLTLHHHGDITVTLQPMTRTEVAEWADITDALNTHGIDQGAFRPTVNGWRVTHPEIGVVGLLFQGIGTRVHAEWYDQVNDDFFPAGWTAKLRHGAAAIVHARQHAGQALPADAPVNTTAPVRPVRLEDGTLVRYHGTLTQLSGGIFRVYECAAFCDHWDCTGYALLPVGSWQPCALHVRPTSVTAASPADAATSQHAA